MKHTPPGRPNLQSDTPVNVLIAEDHTLVREGTRQLLERHGIAVVGEAADGEEAVRLTGRLAPHVVLMDIGMPRLNGLEATRLIKQRYPGVAVLVLTAYDDDQYVFALLEAGAAGYLLKDARGEEVVRAIRAVAAGESVLAPSIVGKVVRRFSGKAPSQQVSQPLSEREMDVLRRAALGESNNAIADNLHLSARTVQVHLSSIFSKFDVASRTEAVLHALKLGIIELDQKVGEQ